MVLLILTTVISILSVLVMPKRISWIEMYTTSLFVMFLGSVADVYLDVKYDLYGFFTKGVPKKKCFIITNGRRYTRFFCYAFLYIAMVVNLKMIRRLQIIDKQK
ncbi:hypothetical protein [Priestia megaterium]|uniref:hypothetical protein n=1 Tax=Priestia megaterium TaxID=1404 RepID=UPI002E23F21A|nr:hypothetical protein [Priestia megaterium]